MSSLNLRCPFLGLEMTGVDEKSQVDPREINPRCLSLSLPTGNCPLNLFCFFPNMTKDFCVRSPKSIPLDLSALFFTIWFLAELTQLLRGLGAYAFLSFYREDIVESKINPAWTEFDIDACDKFEKTTFIVRGFLHIVSYIFLARKADYLLTGLMNASSWWKRCIKSMCNFRYFLEFLLF